MANVSHKTIAHNRKTSLTRSWIFESLMLLIDQKPYNKITVSDITKKAGIARQTFYRSYANKDAVLSEYFRGMINYKLEHDVVGCFQVFFDWFVNDSPLPVEQIVAMLNSMNVSEIGRSRNLPNILVRISEE
jgi:AcrR family transcriptional regulator